ncbi:unnamed protein product [Danaus chrysippus]|uniref:ER membrane protein complex subunit 10 n=1 Tax=Danaus chrysippus TaxID=151541 RepID=A0A8J2W1B8_9NEOP|nr:unnamed protein product [Danaus chrysippus]
MEHSLNCKTEKFCPRGSISLRSMRTGTAVIEQINFNKQHISQLKDLADLDGFYTVRTLVTTSDSIREIEYLSSVKAKYFLDSRLSDVINAWILPNGEVMAVTFQVTNTTNGNVLEATAAEYEINSKFYVNHVDQAPVPDTATYIQKLEREREAKEKGDLKDNRPFYAKYWMYIVPILIFVMISGAANPEPASQPAR